MKSIDAGSFPISKNGTRQWLGERRRGRVTGGSPVDAKDKEAQRVSGPWEIGAIDTAIVGNGGTLGRPSRLHTAILSGQWTVQLSDGL